MSDTSLLKHIAEASALELLSYIMANPDWLTDNYDGKFGTAVTLRFNELIALHDD